MKINEILKEIEKHDWWVEESPATHQTAEWAWHGFIESSKYFVKQYLSIGIFIYRNNFCSEVTPRDEKIKQFYFILQKYKIRTAYVQRKKKEWNRKANLMLKIGWRLLKDIKIPSNAEFSKIYSKFMNLYIDQARYSVFMECIDPFTEDELPIILKKELPEISEDKLGKISADMSALSTLSFMDKERIIFLESSLEALKNKNKIDKIAKELEKKYIWIATHYGKADPKTASKFKKDIIRVADFPAVLPQDQ